MAVNTALNRALLAVQRQSGALLTGYASINRVVVGGEHWIVHRVLEIAELGVVLVVLSCNAAGIRGTFSNALIPCGWTIPVVITS
jgi:hypothetical protein